MPGPGPGASGLPTALAALQRQIERLARRPVPIWLEAIVKSGAASVASTLMPPGIRVPVDCTLRAVYVNVDVAPTGAALVYVLKRKSTGATLATVTIAAGSTSGSATGLSAVLAKGELLRSDITAVGSTVAGSDVLVTIEAAA